MGQDGSVPHDTFLRNLNKMENINTEKTLKIGIIGCGLNSDYHIRFAKEYSGIEMVGVVDRDINRAKDCAARQGIQNYFGSIKDLVEYKKPDVLHIVTPPFTHYDLAREAIHAGCHVLIEKPMAMNLKEADSLFELAREKNVKLCPMHNHYFDPCMLKARELIKSGAAGKIINIESYYGLNTRIDAFRKYPAPNVLPWLYSMPGGVYHDFMPHPLYVLFPYIGDCQEVQVMEKSHGELPQNISDELRIMIKGEKAFGMVTFSFAAKPHLHFIRYYGTRMMIEVNIDTMTTVVHQLSSLPKAAQKATFNLTESWQLFSSTMSNVWNFGRGRLRPYQGMMTLMHQFYDSVAGKGDIPVSREDALRVVDAMDRIWPQIKNRYMNFETVIPSSNLKNDASRLKVLVTGASGFLGRRLVEILIQKGYRVRAFVRKLSNIEKLKILDVEIFFGDVGGIDSLSPAFEGVDVVVHAAADTVGNKDEGDISTIQGTRNVADLCREYKIKKLIYISSCSVYGVADYKKGDIVTEESSLERFPEKRGYYSEAKLKAEQIIIEAMRRDNLPAVCLRPGTYFGPGGDIYTPMMGLSFGTKLFMIIGNGKFVLPLIYIDNLVDAIIATIEKDEGIGKIYNVVDSDAVTKRDYVNNFLKEIYPGAKFFYMPFSIFYSLVSMQEVLTKILKRSPFLTRYRIVSSQKNICYSGEKIRKALNWTPPHTLKEAMEKVIKNTKTII